LRFAETAGLEEAIGLRDFFAGWLRFFVVPCGLGGGVNAG